MNHGQFDKADQLVAAVHRAEGGIFDGFGPRMHSVASMPAPSPRRLWRRRSRERPTSKARR